MLSARILKLSFRAALLPFLGMLLLVLAARPASADDRDLLRTTTSKPYVFIILDTSGSMNWTPPCTQSQFDSGQCSTLCPYRDCFARLQADDPDSKTYQAKAALYQVLQSVNDVQFGFATYNEDDLWVRGKHWIYKAGTGGVTIPGGTVSGKVYAAKTFPAAGADDVFGFGWSCTGGGSGDNLIGCASTDPADLDAPWEVARMQRWPKGGANFTTPVSFFIRWANVVYKVTYTPALTSTPGATLSVTVRVDKCTNGSCSSNTLQGSSTMTFTPGTTNGLTDEFLAWDNGDTGGNTETSTAADPTVTYFSQATASDSSDTNTCGVTVSGWGMVGWDSNNDTTSDTHTSGTSYDLKWPNSNTSDGRGAAFYVGDVIPLDWLTDHKTDILKRLAPNLALDPAATPDFRIATYFNDLPILTQPYLRLKNDNARPLISNGSTPIGNSMKAFQTWYSTGCPTCSPKVTSWKSTAAAQDPQWGCRRKFVLFITDGDETCGTNDPCTIASALRSSEGILTYVVGLGLASNSGNKLTCMAANGGTNAPIYPQNKQELIDALTVIFGQIKESASAFASAAVPSVQIDAADKIYISTFTPLNGESIWNGHIDAYLKPLPLTASGTPDRTVTCPATSSPTTPRSACHLWDAADQILFEAPQASDLAAASTIDANALRLGTSVTTQRRVFYGKAASGNTVPRGMRLFYPPSGAPATDADWQDLFGGFNFSGSAANAAASATRVTNIMKNTLVIKSSTIDNGSGTSIPITFLLGDTFHADPTVIDKPGDFNRYLSDVYGNGQPCSDNISTGLPNNPGFKCFSDKHQFRRKLLAVASDDGQIHFFDAGIYHSSTKQYDDGAGWEVFSYIPRQGLPIVRDQAEMGVHIFGPDLTPRSQDVFIDPSHNGTPVAADRQWRSVVIGGFREGGKPMGGSRILDFVSGYFALDVTQPDTLNATSHVPTTALLPSCMTLGNTATAVPAGCGPVPYPALLWEFTDALLGSRLDEDSNGSPDLGQTWSQPTVGRIRIKNASNQLEERWVAIFGGGLDADFKATPRSGNYLYILDVETGQVLYKQRLTGAVPANPAVIDSNNDGVLDTIYIGTTAGFLYKVDMSKPVQLLPVALAKTQALPNFAAVQTVQRITDSSWLPVAIFDTGGKPIYFGANVLFVAALNSYAITFGTGDREDLWSTTGLEGRFYLIVDQGFTSAQNESNYTQLTPSGASTTADLVSAASPPTGKNRGWYVRLAADERVITKAFGLSGLIVFSSYQPQVTITSGGGGPICGKTGTSFVYSLYLKNGNPVLKDPDTNQFTRYQQVDVFVAPPTVDLGSTKNDANNSQKSSATLTAEQLNIMENLKSYFPRGTRFSSVYYNVAVMGSDTRNMGVAAVPVGILVRNWKQVQ
jgi:hypothetical protein